MRKDKKPILKTIAAILFLFCPWIYFIGALIALHTPFYITFVIVGPVTIYAIAILLDIKGEDRGERDI